MSKLITKTTERAAKGLIVSGDIECQIEVCRLAGRSSFTVLIDGIDKGISRSSAFLMWQWVMDYFNVYDIEEPTKPTKKKSKIKVVDTVK